MLEDITEDGCVVAAQASTLEVRGIDLQNVATVPASLSGQIWIGLNPVDHPPLTSKHVSDKPPAATDVESRPTASWSHEPLDRSVTAKASCLVGVFLAFAHELTILATAEILEVLPLRRCEAWGCRA